jgi:hypothetical protein
LIYWQSFFILAIDLLANRFSFWQLIYWQIVFNSGNLLYWQIVFLFLATRGAFWQSILSLALVLSSGKLLNLAFHFFFSLANRGGFW